jgi:hypothetical protein
MHQNATGPAPPTNGLLTQTRSSSHVVTVPEGSTNFVSPQKLNSKKPAGLAMKYPNAA